MSEPWSTSDVETLFERCSNAGRWGVDDERGTLNLITLEHRRRALNLARRGEVVALGRPLRVSGPDAPASIRPKVELLDDDIVAVGESQTLVPHGFEVTHLDALGHSFYRGRAYNDRALSDVVGDHGLIHASIQAAATGIVTRGVLLDVAAARGLEHLAEGVGVSAADLDAAEAMTGTTVQPGDAVVVRTGLARRVAGGFDTPTRREGLVPDAIPWLRERDVAIYAGDCIERLPSGHEGIPLPLHQVGMVAMGLWFLDNPDVEGLRDACVRFQTFVFALIVAPLALPGASASAVNPLALF